MIKNTALAFVLLGLLPGIAMAQSGRPHQVGPVQGERELSLSGSGSSDRNFDGSTLGFTGDIGWYMSRDLLVGVRQSITYASIEGENIKDDFWNGATRGFVDYHFGQGAFRPFVGASLGGVYGDGVEDTGFAGLEAGLKYYVLPKTFIMGRAEYQWLFEKAKDVDDSFDGGAWAYTVGLGYNF